MSREKFKNIKYEVLEEVVLNFVDEQEKIVKTPEWKSFDLSCRSLSNIATSGRINFDPRFNSVHWANDINSLCRQIGFSLCWMNAYTRYYKEKVQANSQPAHSDFHVSYYASNCITRISSCKDKIALMVWAYYCPFNPEKRKEVLDYEDIAERVNNPVKFGLLIKGNSAFFKYLDILKGTDFDTIEKYRNLLIHRREPQIVLYEVAPHHDWSYLIPLTNKDEIDNWRRELSQQYPDPGLRSRVEKRCYINGVLFDQRKLKDRVWHFPETQENIQSCFKKLLVSAQKCFQILLKRKPFRK